MEIFPQELGSVYLIALKQPYLEFFLIILLDYVYLFVIFLFITILLIQQEDVWFYVLEGSSLTIRLKLVLIAAQAELLLLIARLLILSATNFKEHVLTSVFLPFSHKIVQDYVCITVLNYNMPILCCIDACLTVMGREENMLTTLQICVLVLVPPFLILLLITLHIHVWVPAPSLQDSFITALMPVL